MFRLSNIIVMIFGLVLGALVFPIKDAYSLSMTQDGGLEYNGPTEVFVFDEPFYIPIVENGQQTEIVLIQLALEIKDGALHQMPQIAPKLRHEILATLFDHYHDGHFSGSYMQKDSLGSLIHDLNTITAQRSDHLVQSVLLQTMRKQAL